MNVLLLYRAALISIDGRVLTIPTEGSRVGSQSRLEGEPPARADVTLAGEQGTPPDPIMEELASAKRSVNAIFYEQVHIEI